MQIYELAPIAASALPLAELGNYLRLQTGPTGTVRQDNQLEVCLRASMKSIESVIGRQLLNQRYRGVSQSSRGTLAKGSADQIVFEGVFIDGAPLAVEEYTLEISESYTKVSCRSAFEVKFSVGSEHWSDIEGDLQLAVLSYAAELYERDPKQRNIGMPSAVRSLVEKYRKIRVFRGTQ